MPSEMKRLKMLDVANAGLKRLVMDLSKDKAIFEDVIKGKLQGMLALGIWWISYESFGRSESGAHVA